MNSWFEQLNTALLDARRDRADLGLGFGGPLYLPTRDACKLSISLRGE